MGAAMEMLPVFFAKAVSIFVKNRTARQDNHWQNVIFNCHRIVKVTLACKKLPQLFHHVFGNFALGRFKCRINNWNQVFVVPCRNSSFAESINEDAESWFIHISKYTWPGFHPAARLFALRLLPWTWHHAHMATGRRWTREELFVALNLYHKLTFGQLHARQPAIVALAGKLERGSNSVAMKLCNFASLDSALKLRGIKGLEGASALDREVWIEFHRNLNEAVPMSEEALRRLFGADESSELEVLPKEGVRVRKRAPSGPTETIASVKLRRGQEYFRDAVLNNFGGRCGVTGLAVRELLVASHILPWGAHPAERLNVRNGLSLSRLHDAAFDRGLIAFDDALRLLLAPKLNAELSHRAVFESFGAYAGEPLCLPEDAVLPDLAFLSEHRAKIFSKSGFQNGSRGAKF